MKSINRSPFTCTPCHTTQNLQLVATSVFKTSNTIPIHLIWSLSTCLRKIPVARAAFFLSVFDSICLIFTPFIWHSHSLYSHRHARKHECPLTSAAIVCTYLSRAQPRCIVSTLIPLNIHKQTPKQANTHSTIATQFLFFNSFFCCCYFRNL